jgi:hypothetical protein
MHLPHFLHFKQSKQGSDLAPLGNPVPYTLSLSDRVSTSLSERTISLLGLIVKSL